MKHYLSILVSCIALLLANCTKQKMLTPLNENPHAVHDTVLVKGSFVANAHPTEGSAKVTSASGSRTLVFEGFKTDNGPDLRVYLSKSTNVNDYVEIGKLKAITGDFNYAIPNTVNVRDYRYVLIWCEDVSVLFGHAELK